MHLFLGAVLCAREQEKQFQRMFEQVMSQPHTQAVRDRLVYTQDEDEEEGVPSWIPLISDFNPTTNCKEKGKERECAANVIDHSPPYSNQCME